MQNYAVEPIYIWLKYFQIDYSTDSGCDCWFRRGTNICPSLSVSSRQKKSKYASTLKICLFTRDACVNRWSDPIGSYRELVKLCSLSHSAVSTKCGLEVFDNRWRDISKWKFAIVENEMISNRPHKGATKWSDRFGKIDAVKKSDLNFATKYFCIGNYFYLKSCL